MATPHRYWRIQYRGVAAGSQTGCGQIQMKETAGGPNLSNDPARAIASGSYSGPGGFYYWSRAFDGDPSHYWYQPGGNGYNGNWIGYDFGAGNEKAINYISMYAPEDPSGLPYAFDIESSDDNIAWSFEWMGYWKNWVVGNTYAFQRPVKQKSNRWWGILSSQTQLGNNDVVLPELQMALSAGGPNICPGAGGTPDFFVNFGPFPASNAFDGDELTEAYTSNTTGSAKLALYDFGEGNDQLVLEMSIIASGSSFENEKRAPTEGRLIYSQDGVNWGIGGFLGAVSWTPYERKSWAVSIEPVVINAEQFQTLAVFNVPTFHLDATAAQLMGSYVKTARTIDVTQANTLAVVRGRISNPRVRDFTFTLDGHDFYGIKLGDVGTLIYDFYSEQWIEWTSENFERWRVNCALNWIGAQGLGDRLGSDVLVGDDSLGVLWLLDPNQPYDDHPDVDNPTQQLAFPRVVTSQTVVRGRQNVPCYAVFLDGDNYGITATDFEAGVTLETSDDQGRNWYAHGTIGVTPDIEINNFYEWTSLGQISSPGRLFRVTDNGVFTRLDSMEMNDAG